MPIYSENKIISLNSALGAPQNGTLMSNIVFNTGMILEEDDTIIDSHISVINAQIPVSFYTVTTLNNAISCSFHGSAFSTYLLPVGNYNSNSLILALQTLLGNSLTITFSALTGRLTFVSSTVMNYDFDFNINNSANQALGFIKTSFSSTLYGTLVSPFPINLLGVKRLSIKSYNLGVSSYGSIGSDPTLCVIPSDQPPFSMLSYQNQNNVDQQKIKVKMINSIDIFIYDENNNLIDFNNQNWTLTLCLENVRFKPDIHATFNEILHNKPIEDEKLSDISGDMPPHPPSLGNDELDLLNE